MRCPGCNQLIQDYRPESNESLRCDDCSDYTYDIDTYQIDLDTPTTVDSDYQLDSNMDRGYSIGNDATGLDF